MQSKYLSIRNILIGAFCVFFIILIYAIQRDYALVPQYQRDLRNRITGARLMQDGKDPYFYKWNPTEPLKYFDPYDYRGLVVSSSTASPFFHRILSPLNHLPYITIAWIWLVLEYLFFLLLVFIGIYFSISEARKSFILILSGGFLLTDAWITHIMVGQMYIFIAALVFLVSSVIINSKRNKNHLWLGLLLASTILIRPPVLLIYLPLLFLIKKTYKFCLSTSVWLFVYLIFLAVNPLEKFFWQSFTQSIKIHTKFHEGMIKEKLVPKMDNIVFLESYDFRKVDSLVKVSKNKSHSEVGNILYLQKMLTGINVDSNTATKISVLVLAIIFLIFGYFHRHPTIQEVLILGNIVYLTWELLSPIIRNQYYTVEFFPLVLMVFSSNKRIGAVSTVLIVLGIILNITNTTLIPVRHTIGELFMLVGTFWFLLSNKMNEQVK